MSAPLYEKLISYKSMDIYPFHMPGHKRQVNKLGFGEIAEIDITEIDDFDNLYHTKGIIKEAQNNVKILYGTKESYFLVNGSTVGILTAITSQCKRGAKVIVARNCHKSVYNAIMIKGLDPIYVYPSIIEQYGLVGEISPKEVESLIINNNDIEAVIITSPTYDGVISNIRELAKITNKYNILLIVDEAHGAHLGITNYTANGAIREGADLVIHSLHKTLPALTQTALLHIVSDRVNKTKLERSLSIFQTSSPSYILMASIDNCINILTSNKEALFMSYMNNIDYFRNKLNGLKNIRIVGMDMIEKGIVFQYDITKLIFVVKGLNINGNNLAEELRNLYNVQVEYSTKDYVLAMTSIFDTMEGFNKLADAIISIDKRLYKVNSTEKTKYIDTYLRAKHRINEVEDLEIKDINISDAIGSISSDFIIPYPPGIPLVVPGEILEEETIKHINQLLQQGIDVLGVRDNNRISIIDEEK
jgi:arginine/lysine/ornithine decarboxylase